MQPLRQGNRSWLLYPLDCACPWSTGRWRALLLQFYDRSKKMNWFLVCQAFFVIRMGTMTSKMFTCLDVWAKIKICLIPSPSLSTSKSYYFCLQSISWTILSISHDIVIDCLDGCAGHLTTLISVMHSFSNSFSVTWRLSLLTSSGGPSTSTV